MVVAPTEMTQAMNRRLIVKVNWIRSIACGLGFASLSALPQISFGQSNQYVAPNLWNNFNPTTAAQAGSAAITTDPASPHYRVAQSPVNNTFATQPPQSTYQQMPAQQLAPQPAYSQSTPPSLTAPSNSYPTPDYRVARRLPNEGNLVGGGNPAYHSPQQPMTADINGGGHLASEQFHGNHPQPVPAYQHQGHSPYASAMSAPWEGPCGSGVAGPCMDGGCAPSRPELFPWFGGADILFWSVANSTSKRLVLETGMPSTTLLNTRDVDPGNGIGYDLFFGRYFGCGRHAISINYMNFDPSGERAMVTGLAGDYYAAMPAWENVGYYDDHTVALSPYESMKDVFDGMTSYSIDRDVSFQGLELNMWSFGFGGARRIAPVCGSGLNAGLGHATGTCGIGGGCGFGGFGGPLERPCSGTSQLAFLHGFRWFQFNDDFRFAAYDGVDQAAFDSQTRNDLFGYQVGGRWNYCATCRLNLGVGAKFGAYANSVEVHQRIGNDTMPARYQSGTPASRRHADARDTGTSLAGLGEIDLGAGFRLTDAWTIRGGYRFLGVSGVATSVGGLRHEMFSQHLSARDMANESMLLHGAYVGTEFNW